MESLAVMTERLASLQREQGLQSYKTKYNCTKCKDEGFIYSKDGFYEVAVKCDCQLVKELKERQGKSGLGDLLDKKTFDNYMTEHDYQRFLKAKVMSYVKDFKDGEKVSLALLGQSGIGKTHLTVAVASELIKSGASLRYYIADDIIQTLNACKFDEESYNREFAKIVSPSVLYIDDLFKTSIQNYYNTESINPSDLREIFKVINYRYNKKMPILVNSEIDFDRFTKLDQATIGRINEMCLNGKYLISVNADSDKNYRLSKR